MTPPPYDDDESPMVAQTTSERNATSIGDVLFDRRVIGLLISLIVGGPVATAAVTSYTGGAQVETVETAISEARDADGAILEEVRKTNGAVESLSTQVGSVSRRQQELQVSINGDVTTGKPGIKGNMIKHEAKLDSLKKDIERIKKRDEKRDELEKLDKGLRDYPLARDEVWERPE